MAVEAAAAWRWLTFQGSSQETQGDLRCGRADVCELPLQILLQWLQALECDLELVRGVESSWVVPHGDVEEGDGSHGVVDTGVLWAVGM